jgi:hypothetical protein
MPRDDAAGNRAGPVGRASLAGHAAGGPEGGDVLARYRPPFDLTADMLFVVAPVPTAGLASAHAGVPFLSLGGRTPLLLWFSRVRRVRHGPPEDRRCLDERDGFGYAELNVVAPLRERALFVPGIYATSRLTLRIGHRYGMPKRLASMRFDAGETRVAACTEFGGGTAEVDASLLTSGRPLAAILGAFLPRRSWPVRFPGGAAVRGCVHAVPRARLAAVRGELALAEPWLGAPARLWPLGLYVPGLRMRLPPPDAVT